MLVSMLVNSFLRSENIRVVGFETLLASAIEHIVPRVFLLPEKIQNRLQQAPCAFACWRSAKRQSSSPTSCRHSVHRARINLVGEIGHQSGRRNAGCARYHASVVAIASASGVRGIAPKRALYFAPSSRIGCVHRCAMSATPRAFALHTPAVDSHQRGTPNARGLRPAAWDTSSNNWRGVVRAPGRWKVATAQ